MIPNEMKKQIKIMEEQRNNDTIKTKSDTDITNTNTNINTAHKGGDRNGG